MIRVQGLRKRFGVQEVLRGVDLDIATGEIMIVIGRSGGGKSVLLKHLIGLLRPDAGAVLVDGTDITRLRGGALDRVRERYGVVFQGGALFDSMSVFDNVAFPLREKSRRTAAEITGRVEEKLEQVGLAGMGAKNPAEISGGMRKRVAIARALVTEPEIVFFDEPTTGLDPVGRRLVRDIIHELRTEGAMVFLNSHLLSEVEITCDRVAFIKHGEVIRTSPLQTLVEGELTVEARVRNLQAEALAGLSRWSANARLDGERLAFTLQSEAELPAIHRYLVERGAEVYAFQPQHISLEDLFIQIIGTDGGL